MNLVLLSASLVFYAWGGVGYLLILLALILVNYGLTVSMSCFRRLKKPIFILILAIDIGNLLYFKYSGFFIENLHLIAPAVFPAGITVALPLGISFYTFQIISYVADVYMDRVPVQRNLLKFALYITMFPQLVAGPIVRYQDISTEIDARAISHEDVEEGIRRFIVGFFKKVLIL